MIRFLSEVSDDTFNKCLVTAPNTRVAAGGLKLQHHISRWKLRVKGKNWVNGKLATKLLFIFSLKPFNSAQFWCGKQQKTIKKTKKTRGMRQIISRFIFLLHFFFFLQKKLKNKNIHHLFIPTPPWLFLACGASFCCCCLPTLCSGSSEEPLRAASCCQSQSPARETNHSF